MNQIKIYPSQKNPSHDPPLILQQPFQQLKQFFLALHDIIRFVPDSRRVVMPAIEKDGVPASIAGAFDVILDGIADVPCLGRVQMERILHRAEGPHVRFEVAESVGDKDTVVGEPFFQMHAVDFLQLMLRISVGEDCHGDAMGLYEIEDLFHSRGNIQTALMFSVNVLEFQRFLLADLIAEVFHGMLHPVNACAIHRHGACHHLIEDLIAVNTGGYV